MSQEQGVKTAAHLRPLLTTIHLSIQPWLRLIFQGGKTVIRGHSKSLIKLKAVAKTWWLQISYAKKQASKERSRRRGRKNGP